MTMIARAEMSATMQHAQEELHGSTGMSVALIGPNDTHRQIVARALSSAEGRKVHEFIDYPAKLSDLPGMLEQNFDVVLVDVDTDQSYALQIIENVAEMGSAVMAYSARNDQELLMACMRAGARDFLPLPSESDTEPSQPEMPAAKQAETKVQAAAPAAEMRPASARSNVTPIVPEKKFESAAPEVTEIRPVSTVAQVETDSETVADEVFKPEPVVSDFAEWDAANLRRAQAPAVKRPEARPRPSLVPERKHTEIPPSIAPKASAEPASTVIEKPQVSADIFRSLELRESDEAERQGANWIKWLLIAAGPIVLALVLLIVFTRPSSQGAAAGAKQAGGTPPAEESASTPAGGQLIVDATGQRTPTTPTPKPSPATPEEQSDAGKAPAPVSGDAMAAQLVAPTRIAGKITRTATSDEPPPAAPGAIALEDNSTLPGSVFGGPAKAKYTPKVVPISAGVAEGMVIHRTPPVYPKFAQEAHITGKVVLKATITKQGGIEGVQVISGPKILAPSAVDAVKTWKYRPYLLDGQPIAVETTIFIIFGGK